MECVKVFVVLFLGIMLSIQGLAAQDQDRAANSSQDTTQVYIVIKNDGSRYVGEIISQDAREVHLMSREVGELIIPKHEIQAIRLFNKETDTEKRPGEVFASRYFLTTNGHAIPKGETYIIWNIYGPDIQFGMSKRFSMGLMTTWFGVPIIGTAKYSIPFSASFSMSIGTLAGTGSWAEPEYGIFLPFTSFTLGGKETNLNLAGGYGALFGDGEPEDRIIFSIGGKTALNDRFSLVFDSILIPETDYNTPGALLVPGLRLNTDPNKAFQIGFGAIAADGELYPYPLPMIQWFRRF